MNTNNIEDILDFCLEELKKGIPLDRILAKYPDHAKELRSLLATVSKIESIPKPTPSTGSVYNALVEAGKYLPERKVFRPHFSLGWFTNPRFAFAKALAMVLIISLLTWTTVTTSANALPGDFLYPFKLVTEKIKLILTIDSEGEAELRLTFSEKRMQELLTLYRKKGVVDKELIKVMLDEAKLALDKISYLPKEKQPLFYSKVNHFNAYQKETLQSFQPSVTGKQREYIDRAIEACSSRGEWMQKMMQQGMYCPWNQSSHCDWE